MTREVLAKKIYWVYIIRAIGVMNAFVMLPQLWEVVKKRSAAGLSLPTFVAILVVQWGFAVHGFFLRDRPLMVSNGVAGCMNFAIICSAFWI